MYRTSTILVFLLALLTAFQSASQVSTPTGKRSSADLFQPAKRNTGKLIHVLVALCDNKYQGIVPVPARIGNGDDPANNLYWGAQFGVKTFFKRAGDWKLIAESRNPRAPILERIVFKHQTKDIYLVADAYRGREIKDCITDFFRFSSGSAGETIKANS